MSDTHELYELDERSGRWVATDSGSRVEMEAARERMQAVAKMYDVGGEFAVCASGCPPESRMPAT